MDPQLVILLVGVAGPGFTTLGVIAAAIINSRRNHADEDDQHGTGNPAPPPALTVEQTRSWDDYISRLVDAAVESATRPLLRRIEDYEEREVIVARLIQRLYWWDDGGRPGPMPRLTYDEQRKMNLDLLTDHPQRPPTPNDFG
jgi:hypothetical protein